MNQQTSYYDFLDDLRLKFVDLSGTLDGILPSVVELEMTFADLSATCVDTVRSLRSFITDVKPQGAVPVSDGAGFDVKQPMAAPVGGASDTLLASVGAYSQASAAIEIYTQRKEQAQTQFDEFRASVVNLTGDFGGWIESVGSSLIPISQLLPLMQHLWKIMVDIKNINFTGLMTAVSFAFAQARYQMFLMNAELRTGQIESLGFAVNILGATVAVMRFATDGLFSGMKALGAWLLLLIAGSLASVAFALVTSISFTVFKMVAVAACEAVSAAIKGIPIIGWIATVIDAIIGLVSYFWETSETFRAVFKGIADLAKTIFGSLANLIASAIKFDGKGIKDAIASMSSGLSDIGSNAGDGEITRSKEEQTGKKESKITEAVDLPKVEIPDSGGGAISSGISTIGDAAGGTDKIRSVNISIEKLVDKFEIHTTNLNQDMSKVKDIVAEALISAVNDVNYAM